MMAAGGTKAGNVFVEFGLDASQFTAGQKQILQQSMSTALESEKNFRTLGTQSDLIFNTMKQNIASSLGAIVHNVKSSKEEITRAEQAAADKIKSINERQFGKHNSLIDSIKANYIAMAAAAAAVYAAVIKPIEAYMASETALLKMGMAMKNQGDFTRAGLADMEAFAAQIQRTTAYEDDATLAVMANLKSFGLSNEQVKLATKAALDLATAKANEGMTVERASEILGKSYLGISTGLKKLGIQVDETASKSELFNSVMQQVENRFGGSAQAELLTYAGQWKQLKNQWQDVQEFLGLVFLKTIEAISVAFGTVGVVFWRLAEGIMGGLEQILIPMGKLAKWAGFDTLAAGLEAIRGGLGKAKDNFHDAAEAAISSTKSNAENFISFNKVSTAIDAMGKAGQRTQAIDEEAAKAAKKALQEREAAEKAIIEIIRKATLEIEGINKTQYERDIAQIDSEAQKWRDAGASKVTVEAAVVAQIEVLRAKLYAKNVEEFYKSEEKAILDSYEVWKKTREVEAKGESDRLLLYKSNADTLVKSEEQSILENYENWKKIKDAQAKDSEKYAEERWKIERKLTQDIAKFTNNEYDFKKESLDEQLKIYKGFGIDRIRLERWYDIELKKLDEERILRSNDFWGGMRVAYEQDLRAQKAWGQQGADIWRGVWGKGGILEGTLTGFFTDFFQGHLKTASDYFKSFTDAILAMFAKMIAEMVAMWAASQIAGFFGLSVPGSTPTGTVASAATNYATNSATNSAGNYISSLLGGGTTAGGMAALNAGEATAVTSTAGVGALEAGGGGYAVGAGASTTGAGAIVAGEGASAGGTGAGAAGAGIGLGAGAAIGVIGAAGVVAAVSIYGELMHWGHTQFPWVNPFRTNPDTQSDLGYMAITNAREAPWYTSGNPKLQGLYSIVSSNPWFNPENMYEKYIAATGLTPDSNSIKEGLEWNWFARQPEYMAAVNEALKWQQDHIWTEPGPAEGSVQYNIYHSGIDFVPRTGLAYLERGERVTSAADNSKGGRSQTIHFTWSGNIISTDKSPNQIAREIVRPLKAELRRLEAIGTA